MYAQWRYRGLDPYRVLRGDDAPPPQPDRHEAVLTAFAIAAALEAGAMKDFASAFAEASVGG